MLAMRAEVGPELAWQMGRPVRYGGNELGGFEERARAMIALAESALAPIVPEPKQGFKRYVAREPVGIVLTVAPWNYPYLTAVNSVVPALMAGNAVILKHAAQTLLVGDRFQQAMDRAGLPKGLFRTLTLSHDDTTKLIGSGAVDQICFTGSVAAGKAIEQAAAGTFAGVGLELGGKDPAYVRPDVDLAHAVENVVDGALFQFRPMLLRHRARLRARRRLRQVRRRLRRPDEAIRARRSARPEDHARADGAAAPRRDRARSHRRGAAQGRARADRHQGVREGQGRLDLCGAAGAGGCRSFHEGDDGRDLRPRGRHHEGEGRRRGDPADERLALWADRLDLDPGHGRRRAHRRARSRPAPST